MAGVRSPNPPGRGTKLTAELQERVVETLRAGNYVESACAYAGITTQTYNQWCLKADMPGVRRALYAAFRDSVRKARADAEIRNVALVQRAAQQGKSWQAAAWWLERSFPHRWGRMQRTTLEVSGPNGGPVQVTDPKAALLALLDPSGSNPAPVTVQSLDSPHEDDDEPDELTGM